MAGEITRRYCQRCGALFGAPTLSCPVCETLWEYRPPQTTADLARALQFLADARARGQLSAASYDGVRQPWESALEATRHGAVRSSPAIPPRRPVSRPALASPFPAAAATDVSAPAPYETPREPLLPKVTEWAAHRQADILLYLGAFLLSVAAMIFVAYQGAALTGPVRLAILVAYTLGFLGAGLTIHRWERVREAERVFLALGAVLVPFNFVALRTQVLDGGQIGGEWLWCWGGATSAALYIALASRGHGRYYLVPAVPAAIVAWGAFGAGLGLRPEFYGLWFEVVAAALYLAALAPGMPGRRFVNAGAVCLSASALAYAHIAAPAGGGWRLQLPLTDALAAAALAAGLRARASTWVLAVLPPLTGVAAIATAWATADLAPAWWPVFGVIPAAGYAIIASLVSPASAERWRILASLAGVASLASAHLAQANVAAPAAALPAAYGAITAAAFAAALLWRTAWRPLIAALPLLAGGTMVSTGWAAFGMGYEWWAVCAAVVPAGYILIAGLDAPLARSWLAAAATSGAAVCGAAHLAQAAAGAQHVALAITWLLTLAMTVIVSVRWRREVPEAHALVPVATAASGITSSWAAVGLSAEWYPAFVSVAAWGYLALAAFDDGRARVWRRLGLVANGAALLAVHTQVARPGMASAALPLSYGLVLTGWVFGAVRWRLAWREGLALGPVLAAAFGASLCWSAFAMPLSWLGAWAAGAAAGYLVLAEVDRTRRRDWRKVAAWTGAAAIGWAQVAALTGRTPTVQLPVTYALLTAGCAWDSARRRDGWSLMLPALASMAAGSALWSASVHGRWWCFPAMAIGTATVLSAPVWARRKELVSATWLLGAGLVAGPAVAWLGLHYQHPQLGITANVWAAAVLAFVGWRSRGAIASGWVTAPSPRARLSERSLASHGAFAFVLAATAFSVKAAGLEDAARAWPFIVLAGLSWLSLSASARKWPVEALAIAGPMALVASVCAGATALESPAVSLAAFTVIAAGALLAALAARSWVLADIASVALQLAATSLWRWTGWEAWLLPAAYAGLAGVLWLALWLRRPVAESRAQSVGVQYLLWIPWLVSACIATGMLQHRGAELVRGAHLVETREWAMAAAVLAASSAALMAEGLRAGRRIVWVAGAAGLLGAALMAIATTRPENVQAYTALVGVSLIALGLTWRTSAPIWHPHLMAHEALMIAGALFLLLPPAEQSFSEDALRYGLEIIGIGLALLAGGFFVHARWLVPCGVLALGGAAVRWLIGGSADVPYWLLLGLCGTALIGVAVLLLAQRERWDAFRERCARWWIEGPPATLSP